MMTPASHHPAPPSAGSLRLLFPGLAHGPVRFDGPGA
jgi:hypothetical protein